ncbi:MAG: SAM-dependent methyltransferase, partial [Candidatus Binatia bacterium]
GKVVVVTFGNPMEIEFFGFFISAIQAAVPSFTGPPMDPPPIAFQIVDPEVFRSRMTTAGLKDVKIDTITEKLEFRSGKHFWDWVLGSNPLATMMTADLSKEQIGVVQNAMEKMIRQRATGRDTAVLTNPIHIGIGTK